ncbi:MAG: Holliday junction resolvase RuvX [Phycisphaeraceae bacterium]|nr:Holliday junction resolvase RuvX [Phycisphaerales bacterium]QOJ16834.1 MAG: Holliday junction resolvase RuvX [Phycisphaeraceae bacterium]
MRLMAVDLGDKRTGLAVGDDETGIVTPVEVLNIIRPAQEARLIEAILHAAREHGAAVLVLGLPINMDGSESDRARLVRAFGARLEAAASPPIRIVYQDERLTSDAAEAYLDRSGRTRGEKKQRRDALAAMVILRDYLNQ